MRVPRIAARSGGGMAVAVLAAGLLVLPAVGRGQSSDLSALPPPGVELANPSSTDLMLPAVSDEYRIGVDDLLAISVLQMPEITRLARVAADGTIQLPLLRQPLSAEGKNAHQLGQEIAQALVGQQLAVTPTVRVVVRQVESRPIVVTGMVKNPAVIQASRPMHLLEVLARAGGLDAQAGSRVLVSQPTASGKPSYRSINLENLTQADDPAENPLLYGGEVVRVLQASRVFVVGAFLRPGAFQEQSGQPITILQAVALAEGFSPTEPADRKGAEIIRTRAGVRQTIPVDIDAMLKHKAPDMMLEANDILYVPVSGSHKLLQTALNDVSQIFVLGVGYNATRVF